MGKVCHTVVFDRKAPDLCRVAEKITEITTLPVLVQYLSPAEMSSSGSDASIAFACAPKEKFAVRTVRRVPTTIHGPGADSETQAICLESFVGQECTIWHATLLALEALRGRPVPSIPEDVRKKYGRPITASQLKRRRHMELIGATIFFALTLPVIIPVYLLYILFFITFLLIAFPFAFIGCLLFRKRIDKALRVGTRFTFARLLTDKLTDQSK
jgi:hypothetical protein